VAILLMAVFIGCPCRRGGGYTGTFFNALYVQFYFRLVEPLQPTVAPLSLERTGGMAVGMASEISDRFCLL